jgi:IS30 family transposase
MVKRIPCLIKTDTDDNGIENKYHEEFTKITGIPVYFCDSYCSWQKPVVENVNGRIRKYIPK